jgi:hypothetical protein
MGTTGQGPAVGRAIGGPKHVVSRGEREHGAGGGWLEMPVGETVAHDALLTLGLGRPNELLLLLLLALVNLGEGAAEELVSDDGALGDAAVLVKGASGKRHALEANRHAAVLVLDDAHALFRRGFRFLGGLEEVHRALVMHGELSGHAPLFLPGEDVVETVALERGPMRIMVVSCHAALESSDIDKFSYQVHI